MSNKNLERMLQKTDTRTRRSYLNAASTVTGIGIAGIVGVGSVSASHTEDPSYSATSDSFSDYYSDSGGDFEGVLETSIRTGEAISKHGSFWEVPMRITTNQKTWANPPSGDSYSIDHVDQCEVSINWDNSESGYSGAAVYADDTEEYIGGYDASETGNYDYSQFDAVLEWGWEMAYDTVSDWADATVLDWYDKAELTAKIWKKYRDANSTNDSITRKWDFHWSKQATSLSHYDVRLYESDTLDISVGSFTNTQVNYLYNGLTYSVRAPTASPSSLSANSSTELKNANVTAMKAKELIRNPEKYMVTERYVRDLKPNDTVYRAPVEVTVTDVTNDAPDEYLENQ